MFFYCHLKLQMLMKMLDLSKKNWKVIIQTHYKLKIMAEAN